MGRDWGGGDNEGRDRGCGDNEGRDRGGGEERERTDEGLRGSGGDTVATIVDDNRCVLYVWYDNEFGYSTQVLRVMQHMMGLKIINVPAL